MAKKQKKEGWQKIFTGKAKSGTTHIFQRKGRQIKVTTFKDKNGKTKAFTNESWSKIIDKPKLEKMMSQMSGLVKQAKK